MPAEPSLEPSRRLGRPPTLDREGALLAARTVIAERGLKNTRYADVAHAAGVPVTTLQHAFGSLNAMLMESLQLATMSEIGVLRELSRGTDLSPWERLKTFIQYTIHPPDQPESYLVWIEFFALAGRDPEVGRLAGEAYEPWWDSLEELIGAGRERGEFTSPVTQNLREAAIALLGLIDGVALTLVLRADGPDYERARQISIDAVASMLGVVDHVPGTAS